MTQCPAALVYQQLKAGDTQGMVTTPSELKERQFGMPLLHYAQHYLYGSTGLRIRVFHSIAGMPASCKSPLLFDLMGHICAPVEKGGLGGYGALYELEDKISPTLLNSVLGRYGVSTTSGVLSLLQGCTLDGAFKNINTKVLPICKKVSPDCKMPIIIGLDSIGGAASDDVVKKLSTDGVAAKGYYDKPHLVKNQCESSMALFGDHPIIFVCINQEKEVAAATPYGPPQKKITGGASQVFKDGHMLSASFRTLASGDGKIVTLRTTKTSFSDQRKIEVIFRWNKFGTSAEDAYNHHFEWALASANVLASPEKGVGEIRDIADVKVSDQGLVTCPQLGCRSVKPEEFEAALFAPENADILNALYVYQKIDKLKDINEYAEWVAKRKQVNKQTKEQDKASQKITLSKPADPPPTPPEPVKEEEEEKPKAKESKVTVAKKPGKRAGRRVATTTPLFVNGVPQVKVDEE